MTTGGGCYLVTEPVAVDIEKDAVAALPPLDLTGGDVTADGLIDLRDVVRTATQINTAPPAYPATDCNGDDAVNLFDLVMVATSYGAAGPLPWSNQGAVLSPAGARVFGAAMPERADSAAGGVPVSLSERPMGDGRVAVDVVVQGVDALYGSELGLTYEPQRLRVVDASSRPGVQVEPGAAWGAGESTFVAVNEGRPEVRFAASRTNPARPLTGDLVLLTVTFEVLGGGDAVGAYDLSTVELRDASTTLIPASWDGGQTRDGWTIHVPYATVGQRMR